MFIFGGRSGASVLIFDRRMVDHCEGNGGVGRRGQTKVGQSHVQ
ncbi:hypothetical protein ZEAMMB73_Zm00001d031613 [Zea mays]|uniref:Uncharacterized protein n=1 Tax=Zea mays TaxID=4577 RepID=A0A1D6KJV5_MAIZE|nr:hypothetical protein ZEAMMB73_Zm00001d031613 [Zea mays]